jgi:eukaryotic-like serine/threonine-protein kinase
MAPLDAGSRLGPYEIVALLGAGGMGEVYRARDPRLGREVAVKVLPRAWAGDPERQQRFEAEARAAGAINHPNIVTLHDVGVANGSPYLVTEILEGETLRSVIGRGPSAPGRAVEIVIQTAQGLAAAHAKGIVHRDLKPENLQVLPDGRVKILDFGIAKLTRTEANSLAETTPVFASMTATGTIMGTVSYMAPEQLRDLPVDHRADLFALGAIFQELLTGSQPFTGETAADRVSAILMTEPPPLPPGIERAMSGLGATIAKLLAKRPEGRFDSAKDLAFTLELLADRAASGAASPSAGGGAPETSAIRFRPLTFREGNVMRARFAADGQTVVYQAAFEGKKSEIFLTRVESPEARGLGIRNADLLAVSRSAEMAITLNVRDVGGFVRLGTLARIPMVGGRPRELVEDVFMADWFPDGRNLAAIRKVGGTFVLEAPLGHVIHSTTGWMSYPRVSPDGSQIAFLDHPAQGSNHGHVSVIRPGESPRRLTESLPALGWSAWRPDGAEVWFGGMGIESGVGVSGVNLEGKVRQVYSSPTYAGVDDISSDGDALLISMSPRMRMETSTRAGGPREAVDLTWLDWSLVRDVSADGTTVLFDESGVGTGNAPGSFIRSMDGGPAIRIADGVSSSITEDGRHVLVNEVIGGMGFSVIPIGVGKTRRVSTGDLVGVYAEWMPGGGEVILTGTKPGEGRRLYRMRLDTGSIHVLQDTLLGTRQMTVSPDGSWVLARREDGLLALFPTDGSPHRPFPELDTRARPAGWAGDSRSLFTFRADSLPTPVVRVDVKTGAMEPWMEITPMVRSGVDNINAVNLTRDGERYVCSYMRIDSTLYHVRGLR